MLIILRLTDFINSSSLSNVISYHFSLMKQPDSRELQRQSDFEPGNCLRGLVSLSFFRLTLARVLHGSKSDCRWIDRVFKDIDCYQTPILRTKGFPLIWKRYDQTIYS